MSLKIILCFEVLWFLVFVRAFNQQLGHSNPRRLLPCYVKFSFSEEQNLEQKLAWSQIKKPLALFLTAKCYDKVEQEKGSLEVSFIDQCASVLNPEMNPEALNAIWPILPFGLDVKSIRAKRIELSGEFFNLNKKPLNVHVEGLEVTLGDQHSGSVSVPGVRIIQKEWLEICGEPTQLNEYQAGDGCKVKLLNTKVTISSKRLPGGNILVKIPVADVVSVDEDGREADLDECWKTNEGRNTTAFIYKRVTTEGLHASFMATLAAKGSALLYILRKNSIRNDLIDSGGLSLTWTLEKRKCDHQLVSQKVDVDKPRGKFEFSVPPIFFDEAGTPDLELIMTLSGSAGRWQTTPTRAADRSTSESTSRGSQRSQSSEDHNLSLWGKTVGVVTSWPAALAGSFKSDVNGDEKEALEDAAQLKKEEPPIHQIDRKESNSSTLPPLRNLPKDQNKRDSRGVEIKNPPIKVPVRRKGLRAFVFRRKDDSLRSRSKWALEESLKGLDVALDYFAHIRVLLRVCRVVERCEAALSTSDVTPETTKVVSKRRPPSTLDHPLDES